MENPVAAENIPQTTGAGLKGKQLAQKSTRVFGRDITNLAQASKPKENLPASCLGGCVPVVSLLSPLKAQRSDDLVEDNVNVQDVDEYADDIFALQCRDEGRYVISETYLEEAAEINAKMRAILVDWLLEVHVKFKLAPDTLFLSVSLLDRYLGLHLTTERSKLQLIGVTCLFIAAKYEEVSPPEVRDFVYVTDHSYSRDDILSCEVRVLNSLGWRATVTSPLTFLRRYRKLLELTEVHFFLAQYFLELPLPDVRFLQFSPSLLACAAVLLSNKVMKKSPSWPPVVAATVAHDEATVKACAKQLVGLLVNQDLATLKAVKKKFSSSAYLQVAKLIA